MADYLIYGANGFSGALIARAAVAHGHRPIVAGRNGPAVEALAKDLGLEHRSFPLDDSVAVDQGFEGVSTVLHCAGPFAHTSKAVVDACLRRRSHYLDITGEIAVFEAAAARDREAKAQGIMLMPGVGFDVVPSDCLAMHLKKRLPSATHLALGFLMLGRASRGTATTMTENMHRGGCVRQRGQLTRVPAAWKTRVIDFSTGPVEAITIPWGDVSTAYYSTGIPNIEVYAGTSKGLRRGARLSRNLGWLLGSRPVQAFLKRRIQAGPPGPTEEERKRGRSFLWGEAMDDQGKCVTARLQGPEGYTLTPLTAVAVVDRVIKGDVLAGFQTPAKVYGPDLILQIPGVTREDLQSQSAT